MHGEKEPVVVEAEGVPAAHMAKYTNGNQAVVQHF